MKNRFQRGERGFIIICLLMSPVICVVMGYLSSISYHFFIVRHIMHGAALMWLGIAIVLSKINPAAYVCAIVYMVTMGISAYGISYDREYKTTPYLEETKQFIAEQMQPGDVIFFNADSMYELVYSYYIREADFYQVSQICDLSDWVGKRVWFFNATDKYLAEEIKAGYEINYENVGHYGFRLSGNQADFDVYRLEIEAKEP